MFERLARECPRCGAGLHAQPLRCLSCGKLLPRRLSRARRILENTAAGVLVVALGTALVARHLSQPAGVASRAFAPWSGPGDAPAARSWAVSLEPGLRSVCRETLERYSDRKLVVAALARAAGEQLTPDEQRDALAPFQDERRFVGECLRRAYGALGRCEPFKADLSSPAASTCMVPAVTLALAAAPFAIAAEQAKLARVRHASLLASEESVRLAQVQR